MTEVLVPVRDIMTRTRQNLTFIDQAYDRGERVWEVTQLVNSFMGALAHPWERIKAGLTDLKFTDPGGESWPNLGYEDEDDEQPKTIGHQLRLVRNAFAHGNIHYLNDTHGEVAALRLWNTTPNGEYRTWSCEVELDTLRTLLDKFIEVAMEPAGRINPRPPLHVKHRPAQTRSRCGQCGIDLNAGQLRDQQHRARRQQNRR